MSIRRSVLLALVGLASAGCHARPFTFGPRGEVRDPAELLSALAARSAKLSRLRSEVSLAAKSPRGSGSTGGLVAAARPSALRFEIDDFFGNPAVELTTDGTLLGLYQVQSNVYATGAVSAKNLGAVIPLELDLPEAVDLLFGDPKPLAAQPSAFFVDRASKSYALVFKVTAPKERTERLDLDPETWVPVDVQVEGAGPYSAAFSDFEGESGLRVPKRVEIESPQGRVAIGYRRLEVNPTLDPAFFVPQSPKGAKAMEFAE